MNILLSRTDSIGDVILTLPLAGLIKEKYPQAKILFLGKTYTKDIIECSKYIDKFLNWNEIEKLDTEEQINILKKENIDVFVHVFPNKTIAKLAKSAGIKTRIGTSHRVYHYLNCNKLPSFSRKNSNLHEAQLNVKLLESLDITFDGEFQELQKYYGFDNIPKLTEKWKSLLSTDNINIILHTKSQGSAREWGLDNFRELINISIEKGAKVFLTGTEAEGKLYRDQLVFDNPNLVDLSGKMSLNELIAFIYSADVLVAASTGPLHIAAACDSLAIGIFPPIRPIHPGRWAPIGLKTKVLSIDKPNCTNCLNGEACACMSEVSPQSVWQAIKNK